MGFPATTDVNVIPLREDEGGVVRIGQTRVTLDSVIWAFRNGATAEEIAQRYPTLELADVYSVITYYLHQTSEVDAYLGRQQARAATIRADCESRFDPVGVRERLVARRTTNGQ